MENQSGNGDRVDILDKIFAGMDGYKISNRYRDQMKITDKSYTYGEAKFADFAKEK